MAVSYPRNVGIAVSFVFMMWILTALLVIKSKFEPNEINPLMVFALMLSLAWCIFRLYSDVYEQYSMVAYKFLIVGYVVYCISMVAEFFAYPNHNVFYMVVVVSCLIYKLSVVILYKSILDSLTTRVERHTTSTNPAALLSVKSAGMHNKSTFPAVLLSVNSADGPIKSKRSPIMHTKTLSLSVPTGVHVEQVNLVAKRSQSPTPTPENN